MIRTLCAAALLVAAIAINQRAALAYEAPWCAIINNSTGSAYWDCQYRSFEHCYASSNLLAGNRGFCNQNPAYRSMERNEYRARRHSRRH